jgi:protein involved in polysaccharide export with SLBB domain
MKKLWLPGLFLVLLITGCVSKATADAKARAAFLAGQQRAAVVPTDPNTVWVVGNVERPLVPWTEDLTLAKAIIASGYRGEGDPSRIVLLRNGAPTTFISAKQLLNGFDLTLQPGDRIEIRP